MWHPCDACLATRKPAIVPWVSYQWCVVRVSLKPKWIHLRRHINYFLVHEWTHLLAKGTWDWSEASREVRGAECRGGVEISKRKHLLWEWMNQPTGRSMTVERYKLHHPHTWVVDSVRHIDICIHIDDCLVIINVSPNANGNISFINVTVKSDWQSRRGLG